MEGTGGTGVGCVRCHGNLGCKYHGIPVFQPIVWAVRVGMALPTLMLKSSPVTFIVLWNDYRLGNQGGSKHISGTRRNRSISIPAF